MIACVDVAYGDASVSTAVLCLRAWPDARAASERVERTAGAAAPYTPGEFYKRELPYLLAVLRPLARQLATIVVDGYAWLGPDHPGLGAHLQAALGIAVIGVAKSRFIGAPAVEVVRGRSTRPLQITAAGLPPEVAAAHIRSMHGIARIPEALRRVDLLARGRSAPQGANDDDRGGQQ